MLFNDIAIAARSFRKDRGFTATVVLTLALAIGVNTATFAIVNAVLLKPLPVPEADRIVLMSNQYPRAGVPENNTSAVGDYYDRLKDATVFEEQAMYRSAAGTLDLNGVASRIQGMSVTPSLFRLLRVAPASGRIFSDAEGEIGNHRKVILSAGLARELFAEQSPIGKQIRMDGRVLDVVGVMPAGFLFMDPEVRYWRPLAFDPREKALHHSNNHHHIGRLKPGETIERAQSQVDAINAANNDRFPEFKEILKNAGFFSRVEPLQGMLVRDVKRVLYLLWGGAMLVLLIGGINAANLALARLAARRKEFATRMAIGAGRMALVRQLVVEHIMLALGGGVAGLLLGVLLLRGIATIGLDHFPRASEVGVDVRVVLVSMALAVLAGILIALLPLASVFRTSLMMVLHEDSRGGTAGTAARRTRQGLVSLQVAMAFALLVGAGLLLASFRQLLQVNPGFRSQGVVTASVSLPSSRYEKEEQRRAFESRALEAIRRLPQVSAASASDTVPFSGSYNDSVVLAEGYQLAPGESVISPRRVAVSTGYFDTMQIGLVNGRFFNESDNENSPSTVIVDERLARKFWPGRDAIGMRLRYPQDGPDMLRIDAKTKWMHVVGVVRSVRLEDLAGSLNTVGTYYVPYMQNAYSYLGFIARTDAADPAAIVPAMRAAIASIDRELALSDVKTMTQRAELSLAPRRASMSLAIGFAGLALFLAATGLYGVLAFVVAQRNREIGIRMALGGSALDVIRLVLRESLALTAVGMAAGVLGAFALRNIIANEVYGVKPLDPTVMATVALVLLGVTLVASIVPARTAARVDPAHVLRG